MTDAGAQFTRLLQIMARLRAEGGCPWDREQDLRSLRPYLIEEAYEVLDEMDRVAEGGDWQPLCEELGDLLFQIVFHAQLASEQKHFTAADVCKAIADKIERRHPHVFAQTQVRGADEVLQNWAKLKALERKKKTGSYGSVLDGVPKAAPALQRAERLTEKASRIGFDWPDLASVRAKVKEELAELDEAIAQRDRLCIEHELGDVFFALANLARFVKTPPEDAVRGANRRFTWRFHRVEAALREAQVPFGQATLEQMDAHWNAAKAEEKALFPPAQRILRVAMDGLELRAPDLEHQCRFWDSAALLLGWEKVSGDTERVSYSDGAFHLTFVKGAAASCSLWLSAPSPQDVQSFFDRLLATGVSASPPRAMHLSSRAALATEFRDPAGHLYRYAFHPFSTAAV